MWYSVDWENEKKKKSLCCPFSHVVISFFNYVLPTAVLQLRNKA